MKYLIGKGPIFNEIFNSIENLIQINMFNWIKYVIAKGLISN